uniref:Uncharacterized protein n=1 Tax=Cucumis melo TaxID=3656 RepID=A0A9I9CIK7_CUCME
METKATDSKAVVTDQRTSSTMEMLRRPRRQRRNQAEELQFHEKSEERRSVHRNMEDLKENSNSVKRNADLGDVPAIALSASGNSG